MGTIGRSTLEPKDDDYHNGLSLVEWGSGDDVFCWKRRGMEVHEAVTLDDVEVFRERSLRGLDGTRREAIPDQDGHVYGRMIYRCIDIVHDSLALLEAIHVEVFAPDRPDLRFIAAPAGRRAIEGRYNQVNDVNALPSPAFAVELEGTVYPVVWNDIRGAVGKCLFSSGKIERVERSELAYVVLDDNQTSGRSSCINEQLDVFEPKERDKHGTYHEEEDEEGHDDYRKFPVRALSIRNHHWQSPGLPLQNTIVRVTTVLTSSDHLYPVEPIRNATEYAKLVRGIPTSSQKPGRIVITARQLDEEEQARIHDRLDASSMVP
ncbi:hypothetical protein PENTCL1PPCAC_4188 [Pristionchus entomophagus]|uniref:Uncharacterized protein n=1 Tax=Pristionchus entomophagus TaxID=358040 RepID=A0AAV5SIQ3_9BILA|nr:hypothetical protein PENTCL1PPCAC_4188 [Pristionchus entomophagus]